MGPPKYSSALHKRCNGHLETWPFVRELMNTEIQDDRGEGRGGAHINSVCRVTYVEQKGRRGPVTWSLTTFTVQKSVHFTSQVQAMRVFIW